MAHPGRLRTTMDLIRGTDPAMRCRRQYGQAGTAQSQTNGKLGLRQARRADGTRWPYLRWPSPLPTQIACPMGPGLAPGSLLRVGIRWSTPHGLTLEGLFPHLVHARALMHWLAGARARLSDSNRYIGKHTSGQAISLIYLMRGMTTRRPLVTLNGPPWKRQRICSSTRKSPHWRKIGAIKGKLYFLSEWCHAFAMHWQSLITRLLSLPLVDIATEGHGATPLNHQHRTPEMTTATRNAGHHLGIRLAPWPQPKT